MSANVESMFYRRSVPWHGLDTKVDEAKKTLQLADKYMHHLEKAIVIRFATNTINGKFFLSQNTALFC